MASPRLNRAGNNFFSGSATGLAIYAGLATTALCLFLAFADNVNWDHAVLYQLILGLLIAGFGGAIVGWGIAAFLGSADKKPASNNAGPAAAPIQPAAPAAPVAPEGEQEGEKVRSPDEVIRPDDSIAIVSGIGRERARSAATLGFQTFRQILTANREQQKQLREVLGTHIFLVTLLIAQSVVARSRRQKEPVHSGEGRPA